MKSALAFNKKYFANVKESWISQFSTLSVESIYLQFLKTSLDQSSSPVLHAQNIANSQTMVLEIIDLKDISKSLYSQLDEPASSRNIASEPLEAAATQLNQSTASGAKSTLHVVLSDGNSTLNGFAFSIVSGLSINTGMGSKVLLKNATFKRGAVLLTPSSCVVLGGLVQSLHVTYQHRLQLHLGIEVSQSQTNTQESGQNQDYEFDDLPEMEIPTRGNNGNTQPQNEIDFDDDWDDDELLNIDMVSAQSQDNKGTANNPIVL